eukprot:1825164-Pleurochrysis_carterae.AAC.2
MPMTESAVDSADTRAGSTGNPGEGWLVLPVFQPHDPLHPSQEPGDARVPRHGECLATGLT